MQKDAPIFLSTLRFLLAWLISAVACASAAQPASQPSAHPICTWDETRTNPPEHLHFARIDLRDPTISVHVERSQVIPDGSVPWNTALQTVRMVAQREALDVAINGNLFETKDVVWFMGHRNPYFAGNWAKANGWAMSDGLLWAQEPSDAVLIVEKSGRVRIGRFNRLPPEAQQVASGSDLLVSDGKAIATGDVPAPRTAAGVDHEGRTLVLLVVDGRRPDYSAGLTLGQLAHEMFLKGCTDALNLDGGGSSTMVAREPASGRVRLISYPSDGHDFLIPLSIERPVADVLGVVKARAAEPKN
jgi:hypothetical protein